MLGFLMDCWLAGIAITVMVFSLLWLRFICADPYQAVGEILKQLSLISFFFGASIYLLSHFVMSWWLMWNNWD